MYETKNDLPEATRSKLIELLGPRLADAIDLQHQAKQAHWNVKGPNFLPLHKLFDDVAEEAEKYVDLIAERIVQLGGIAEGTIQAVSKSTTLEPYPLGIADGREHVTTLASRLARFARAARDTIARAEDLGDRVTADIFTDVARGTDMQLWFVEAHVQGAAVTQQGPRKKQVA